jgi:hypothetical protein
MLLLDQDFGKITDDLNVDSASVCLPLVLPTDGVGVASVESSRRRPRRDLF